ncbi:Agd3-related carbohydrate-binding protein [Actinoplanes auranticolor]|uniref:Agd3 CBM87 domain-containing protein n=1 Tax=Actinoplanes auranticolor TaxID=47988 RepID=A0A919SXL1_9ACTN|nr:hypothetical protein [Actinoplanes auranticolor]GIM79534.1 hypothetical protein Aau02nite_86260 [Actinoplanes auranticolor]
MVPTRPARRGSTRTALVATAVVTVLIGAWSPAAAQATGALGKPAAQPPNVPGLAQVARPTEARPAPLPKRSGSVKVVKPAKPARAAAAAAGLNDQVALRALVIGTDANDFGVATWKTTLDRVGASYDVLYDATTPLTTSTLVRPDGVGRYNAILLTNSMQVYESNGSYLSGLDPAEWNILWAYERNFGVRQAALYTSYGTWPENYCLTSTGETGVGSTPINLSLTPTGAGVFDYLKSSIQIPLVQSYVYRTAITPGCSAEATITNGSDVLGVRTTSTDGRERLALTFTSNQYLMHSDLLVYGMLRWASKGMFLGEQRHHLNVDIDDWFNASDHYYPDGHVEYTPGFQVSGHDTVNLDNQQAALRTAHPQAADFKLNIAYNGADIDPFAGNTCSPNGGIAELTATTKCLKDNFRWVNHTLNHPELNHTDYATSYAEINDNRAAGNAIGLNAPDSVLKTPEYSGLGVYNPDPDDDTSPPVDHGLAGSNPELLRAAKDLNVKYLHGNMSFASHVPANLNAAKVHPLEPSISVVPDWPTNIAYHVTTPQEQTAFYNSFYGPDGRFPYWPQNLTYEQIIDYEAGVALAHVASGAIYAHTFHIANVRDYGAGRTLLTDWIDAAMTKYDAFYSVPLLNQDWPALAAYTSTRTAHFAQLGAGVDPVYDRSTGSITVTSPAAGTLQISGAQGTGASTYGTDVTTTLALAADTAVTVTAVPHL